MSLSERRRPYIDHDGSAQTGGVQRFCLQPPIADQRHGKGVRVPRLNAGRAGWPALRLPSDPG